MTDSVWTKALRKVDHRLISLHWRFPRLTSVRKVVRHNGVSFHLRVDNPIEYYRWRSFVTKEPETLRYIETYIRDKETFYDVGANIGVYSLYCAKLHPSVKVVAFEPEASNYARLNQHVWENGLADVIRCYPLCVSAQNTPSILFLRDRVTGAALHSEGDTADQYGRPFKSSFQQGTYCITLDDFVALSGSFPNHIKIDVDGNEGKVFEGMRGLLSDRRLRTVCVELLEGGKTSAESIHELMTSHGFKMDNAPKTGNPVENTIFFRD